jgi:hypothetical protein
VGFSNSSPWDIPAPVSVGEISNHTWPSIPSGTKTAIAYGYKWTDPTNVCKSYRHMFLPSVKPDVIEVCVVTVNDTNQNVVVWDRLSAGTNALSGFTIYREDFLSGDFEEIYTTDSLASEYTDKYSDAGIKSYRYKISVEDQCGMRSDPSGWHRASHLNVYRDATDDNLIRMNFEPIKALVLTMIMSYISCLTHKVPEIGWS